MPGSDGFIPFREYKTYYRIVGDLKDTAPGKFPVLALHGLPVSHQSLQPLAQLLETGRPVIFYDQLGCGKSEQPDDESIWSMDLFVEQLVTVREALGLDQGHLLGHSFGGMISLEYMRTKPLGIMSLTLYSTPVSFPLYAAEWDRLTSELPLAVQETLSKHETDDTTNDPAYEKARKVFDQKHIWRVDPLPDYLQQSLENLQIAPFFFAEWDFQNHLGEIDIPTLITSGEYDTVTPMMAEILRVGITGSEWVLFEECSHFSHAEKPELVLSTIDDFLSRIEKIHGHGN